ncbi:MAG: spore cortex biosynthesis protein YabQ [Clostridia bacterium]
MSVAMYVTSQLIEFLQFVAIGILIAIIFDFFRAYRKLKYISTFGVIVQDIIYFFIATIVIVIGIITLLNSSIRVYTFLAIISGCSIYFFVLSSYVIKFYICFFKVFKKIISYFLLPINLNIDILKSFYTFFKKILKKCCKMFFYVVFCIRKIFKKLEQKRGRNMRKAHKPDLKRKDKRKSKKGNIITVLSVVFVSYFVFTVIDQQSQIKKYDSQIEMYKSEIQNKVELTEYYGKQKSNIKSDEYIENVAREDLGYVKPYEKVFIDANK